MLADDGVSVNPKVWTEAHVRLLKRAASYPEVERVLVPEGITVTVEGQPVVGPVEVPAGTPQRIRVEGADFQPWEQSLTFGAGEMRLLIVTPAQLTPRPPP